MSVINQQVLKATTAGSDELLAEIAEKFLHKLPLLRQCVDFGIVNGQPKLIESAARQLKNHFVYFGAESLERLAQELETSAKGEQVESLEKLNLEIGNGVGELLVELRELMKLPTPSE